MTTYQISLGYNSCNTGAPTDERTRWFRLASCAKDVSSDEIFEEIQKINPEVNESTIREISDAIVGDVNVNEIDHFIQVNRSGSGQFEYACRAFVRIVMQKMHTLDIEINVSVM